MLISPGVTVSNAQTITAVPKFVPGQVLHLELTQGRKDHRVDHTAHTPLTVTVLESNENGAVIRWSSGETELKNVPPQMAMMLNAMTAAVKDMNLLVQLSRDGEFERLLNEAEVLEALGKVSDAIISEVKRAVDPQLAEKIDVTMRAILTPAVLLQGSTKSVQMYTALSGVVMDVGKSVTTQTKLESPLGVIESEVTIDARKIDADAREAVLGTKSVPSPEAAKAFTEQLVRKMAPGSTKEMEQAMEKMTFELVDETEYVLDLETGWMKSVDHRRVMKVAGQERVDTTRIRLVRVEGP